MGGTGRWWLLLGALLLLLAPPAARADGCFFKQRRFEAPPPIPAQRALIVHREGVETLVVESTVDAEGQSFGWVLPVPARPTAVEVATPGVLDTLELATRPEVRSEGSWFEVLGAAWLLALLFLTLRLFQARRLGHPTLPPWAETLVVALLLVSLAWVLLVPNLLAARQGGSTVSVAGVDASDPRRVGNYEVTVLEARDGSALGAWLEGNGFAPVPAAGRPVVDDYAARGWVFVAARLAREGTGPAAPHPLSVVFPAPKPVYPMRLTALAGGVTNLRLFVAADGSAACPPLTVRFSQRFEEVDAASTRDAGAAGDRVLSFGGLRENRTISHPFLRGRLWSGCVLTRLEGSMAAASMDRDLEFEVGDLAPRTLVLRTPGEAWRESLARVLPWWAAAMLLLLFLPDSLLLRPGSPGFPFLRRVLLLAAAAALAAAGIRWTLPTIPGESLLSARRLFGPFGRETELLRESDAYAGKPLAEVRALLEGKFREFGLRNPYTGRPVRWGDSPGDFQVFEDHRGPVVRVASSGGGPMDRPWFTQRLHQVAFRGYGNRPKGTAAQAREWLFPSGAAPLLSPFTGAPVREGRAPGDAELLDLDGTVVLRAWFREGKHEDFPLR